jgi:pilus assembly protein CpaC
MTWQVSVGMAGTPSVPVGDDRDTASTLRVINADRPETQRTSAEIWITSEESSDSRVVPTKLETRPGKLQPMPEAVASPKEATQKPNPLPLLENAPSARMSLMVPAPSATLKAETATDAVSSSPMAERLAKAKQKKPWDFGEASTSEPSTEIEIESPREAEVKGPGNDVALRPVPVAPTAGTKVASEPKTLSKDSPRPEVKDEQVAVAKEPVTTSPKTPQAGEAASRELAAKRTPAEPVSSVLRIRPKPSAESPTTAPAATTAVAKAEPLPTVAQTPAAKESAEASPPAPPAAANPATPEATPTPAASSDTTPRPVEATPVPLPVQSKPGTPSPFVVEGSVLGPFEVIEESGEITLQLRRSKLLRTRVDVYRTAVVDPSVCDVIQFTPRELSLVGKGQGATHMTFWFDDKGFRPVTYLVRVVPDPDVQKRREEQYGLMAEHLAELFPNSKVELVPVADKLIVRGQARDAAEAAQIMAVIRGELVNTRGLTEGRAADPLLAEETGRPLPPAQVINMLRIPGIQQVALRVKIAELNRSAARNFGVDMDMSFADGKLMLQSLLNVASGSSATVLGNFDGGDIQFGIHYLEKHGVMRMLSEPTLVTLSGRPATFIAGGEFAVPTTVGVQGASAVTTDFRAYGAIITFLPVVVDKDHIRLEVAPEFSKINNDVKVNGTPGLSTRAVTTTVEMREGQTLAIAGLLDDSMKGDNEGNLPFVAQIFGKREMTRNETELIILVTPELVQPMEPEEVPPLPGFDVTEPTNCQFYLKGRIEGTPTQEYRSTVWPRLRNRYQSGGPAMISGPFGHGE